MQDAGTELHATRGGVQCSIRCKTAFLLDYHVQRNHTADGLALKLHSETQMAQFFDRQQIPYERDHANRVDFGRACAHVQFDGNQFHSRPDFWLPTYSARLGATVIICNDEFAHRRYSCELQRLFNTVNALCAQSGRAGDRFLFVRVNPHFHFLGTVMYDISLPETHRRLLALLDRLRPEDLRIGVSLAFLGYDRDKDGALCLFQEPDVSDTPSYTQMYQSCVIHVE
jgi:hypothetical protein